MLAHLESFLEILRVQSLGQFSNAMIDTCMDRKSLKCTFCFLHGLTDAVAYCESNREELPALISELDFKTLTSTGKGGGRGDV